ncbi:MAG TPA: allantoate amidohydrolase [Ferruginibacter sp.]|nr:allantoate amidohydrolase [Ferruginibacter sp.]HMP21850.1 allantoate amidohydrolase [Ferruginibacter sp.]
MPLTDTAAAVTIDYTARAKKIAERIDALAAISEEEGCVTRTFGTAAFIAGCKLVKQWFTEAGLQTWTDNIGNVRGRLVSTNTEAKTLVIASHIDTVVNAGKFDGPLGVLMGLDIVENLQQTGTSIPFHIELVAFSDEEGCRFHTTYLGSKVLAGSFDENLLTKKDKEGIALLEVLQQMDCNAAAIAGDSIARQNWLGYFEIHIEQGPVLYENNIPVAVVTAIAGQRRVELVFEGVAGHAGTVPMDMRKDALCAAAEFILATEDFALHNKEKIVATTGKLDIHHAASNVIPGRVTCSLDLRSADEVALETANEAIRGIALHIAEKRNLQVHWNMIQQSKPVACDAKMTGLLAASIQHCNCKLVELVSGAGHDAVPISAVAPVTMMFVRCFEGISHNPLENAEIKDIAAAIQVADNFIQQLAINS